MRHKALVFCAIVSLLFNWPQVSSAETRAACSPTPSGRLSPYWSENILRWEKLIVLHATREGLDPDLVASVLRNESAGDPEIVSPAGAVGLMQVMPLEAGFTWRPSVAALRDPATNIRVGAEILSQVIGDAQGNVRAALGAYNGGWGGYHLDTPQDYAGWVLADYARALAARNCWSEPNSFALMIYHYADKPSLVFESGCLMDLAAPAFKSNVITVYPLVVSCQASPRSPKPTRSLHLNEVEP